MSTAAYPPIDDLVPHGPPIRAVEELVSWAPGSATCRLRVRGDTPFVRDERLPAVALLEFMAQSVAACLGYEAFLGGGRVRVGMIIGVRKLDLTVPHLAVGTELTLNVERIRGDEDVSTFRAEARADGEPVCSAHLTLVHPETPPAD